MPFFARNGYEISSDATLDIVAMAEVPTIDAARLASFVRTLDLQDCEALVLLATDLPTFASIVGLEAQIGVPVLTSNQTILWAALRALNNQTALPLGRLFAPQT